MTFIQFLRILQGRTRLIVLVTIAMLGVAAAAIALLPKRYVATASVVVDVGMQHPVSGTAVQPQPVASAIATQLDIIASPQVAQKVVEALGLEQRPDAGALLRNATPLAAVKTWLALLSSGSEQERPRSLKEWLAERLLRDLELQSRRDSQVIKLRYTSADPQFAAEVANAFVHAYLDTTVQLRVQPARQSTRWFDDQLQALKRNLEMAEARLSKFQQDKGIVASDERLDVENARLAELSSQLIAAQAESYGSEASERQIRQFLAAGAKPENAPPEVLSNALIQQLRHEIAQKEAKLGELSLRIGRNHPQYQAALSELARLRIELTRETRQVAEALASGGRLSRERTGALRRALEQQKAKVLKLKSERDELAILSREVENARRAYDAAAQRFTQAKMESQLDQANVSVINPASVPLRPAYPNATLILALGFVGGLALGISLALACEAANRYVRSDRDLVEALGLPVLAVLVPRTGGRQNVARLPRPNLRSLHSP
ncbi:chain length determinant protein EpsF [Pelomicrobium sp.]|jgi:succinoglycan biosynthesis transport protein ExoP|uniref:chain length determinant protein EpsF n=1 Tax=Pelomicrobium sp. TaxID=2815319 RepID=UPI002FDEF203